MIVSSSTNRIIDIDHPRQGIINLSKGGFENVSIDFGIGYSTDELEDYGKNKKRSRNFDGLWSLTESMVTQIKQSELNIPIARAPYLKADTRRTDLNGLISELTDKCINLCGEIGCGYIIVPPLFSGVKKDDIWRVNHDYYIGLAKIAIEYNMMILLSNQVADFNGHLIRGICSNPQVAAKWIDDLNDEIGRECFGFCMDVGVCNICGQNMRDFAVVLGNRIKAVVLRDCDSNNDSSILPFLAIYKGGQQTDWLNLIRGLREISFDGHLIIDYSDSVSGFPLLLRQRFVNIAREMGDYLKWQIGLENVLKKYDKRVLFGAGNMCRNYMKCYGKQYPPLYTCDNNSKLWGTTFEGLEVKSPEALKYLPNNCAIYICNIYYEEIKEQLLGMGITNHIEYFNDEYMPSFYFDRLDVSKREVR